MKIGTVQGIGVYIHWTFWVLIAFYLLPILASQGVAVAVSAALFIAGVFACVVAHEFGHVAAAARYGIPTKDVTLLPIGGVARLERMPEKPVQELVIAIAGPAVNAAIALALLFLYWCGMAAGARAPGLGMQSDLVVQLIAANIILFAFNLLPAFPMDGGRVLRGLLAMRTTYLRATQIAARVGRWMALLFAILAFTPYGNITLLLLAGFIVFAGTAELLQVKFREAAKAQAQMGPQGTPFGAGGPQGGAGWYTQLWPEQQGRYGASQFDAGDVIDAVDVKEVDSPHGRSSDGERYLP